MSYRELPIGKITRPDGTVRHGRQIECAECHATDVMVSRRFASVSAEHVIKRFARMGWVVGARPHQARCPACAAKKQLSNKLFTGEETVRDFLADDAALKSAWAAGVSFNGQRIIPRSTLRGMITAWAKDRGKPCPSAVAIAHVLRSSSSADFDRTNKHNYALPATAEKDVAVAISPKTIADLYLYLADAYNTETKNYSPGWSDQTIADKLGVPVDVVVTRREQDFGPLAQPVAPPADTLLEDIAKRRKQIGELVSKVLDDERALETVKARLAGEQRALDTMIDEALDRLKS